LNSVTRPARPPVAVDRLVSGLAWCALACLLATWFALRVLGDQVWWSVPLVFGPRWLLAAPVLGFVPWLLRDVRRAALPAVAGIAIALFAIIGWHIGLRRAGAGTGLPYRVLELNAEGGTSSATKVIAEFGAEHPDLFVVAECGPQLAQLMSVVNGYHFRAAGDLCLLVRGDVIEWAPHDQSQRQDGTRIVVRAVVATPSGPIRVGLVHFTTPRDALDNYFELSHILRQAAPTRANMARRDGESRDARSWILAGAALPTLIVGDFNLPVESAIYRRNWGTFRNTFSRAGSGAGYTKYTRLWGIRIDHILTTDDISTRQNVVDPDVGSDHRPVIADLMLPAHTSIDSTSPH
jgi:vancomycin resistance protein VanJ